MKNIKKKPRISHSFTADDILLIRLKQYCYGQDFTVKYCQGGDKKKNHGQGHSIL